MVDEWVPVACANVRAMLDASDSDGAAMLAADIEAAALGRPARRCSACESPAVPGRPWCEVDAPCFIPRPDAEPGRIWSTLGMMRATEEGRMGRRKLSPAQRDEIRTRRAAGEDARALAVEYGVHFTHAYRLTRGAA